MSQARSPRRPGGGPSSPAEPAAGTSPAKASGTGIRERILDGTVQVGASGGWGAITTRAVAGAASANQGLVHYHFGSIEALRRAAVHHCLEAVEASVLGLLATSMDEQETLEQALATIVGSAADDVATLFLYEAFLASRRDEELRGVLAASLDRARTECVKWLSASTTHAGGEGAATVFMAALDGLFLHRLIDPDLPTTGLVAPLVRLLGVAEP